VTETPSQEPTGQEVAADEAATPDRPVTAEAQEREASEPEVAEPAEPTLEEQLAERTLDLQRVQAQFITYKRRTETDLANAATKGQIKVISSLLTVLDDVDRADQHGELVGGFKAVADVLQGSLAKFGLESFGAVGEEFDPNLHDAVFHAGQSPEVSVTSIAQVMQVGYRVGDQVVRPAVVGVVEPGEAAEVEDESVAHDGE
jgi:molecular chaperone GrpE